MASILRRGDSYSVRFKYKDHAGRICEGWESFKTKKEAQDRKISVEKELLDGTFLIPDAMTVAEMLYKWLPIQSSKHKWAPKTYTHTVAMIQNLVVPYLGKKQIQKVQTYDLEQFYATLSRTPRGLYKQGVKQTLTDKQKRQFLTGASIREVHAMLKTAFSYAVEWGLLLKSPIPREAPEALSKWYRAWRAEHPEFEKIVFHGLRHSSATYQLIESGGNIKAVQGNTGHATTGILMDTYAHTQDKPRLELAEKLEADFYSQDIGSPKSGSVPVKENLPDSIQITPEGMLKVVRQMNPEQRREFTRLLFA